MSDENKQVNRRMDERVLYSGILVLIIVVSMYGESVYGIPFKDSMSGSFIGIGVGTMFIKLIFGK